MNNNLLQYNGVNNNNQNNHNYNNSNYNFLRNNTVSNSNFFELYLKNDDFLMHKVKSREEYERKCRENIIKNKRIPNF